MAANHCPVRGMPQAAQGTLPQRFAAELDAQGVAFGRSDVPKMAHAVICAGRARLGGSPRAPAPPQRVAPKRW